MRQSPKPRFTLRVELHSGVVMLPLEWGSWKRVTKPTQPCPEGILFYDSVEACLSAASRVLPAEYKKSFFVINHLGEVQPTPNREDWI